MKERIISEKAVFLKTIFAFVIFIAAFSIGVYAWKKLRHEVKVAGVQSTLRKGLNTNEKIFSGLFSDKRLVKTYPISEAVAHVRVNGKEGDTLSLTLEDIKKLPKTDIVFDFKCIEGWSQKTWWSGVKFADFVKFYHLDDEAELAYAGLATPDKEYYVGIDMASM